jgi:hypothetical protein
MALFRKINTDISTEQTGERISVSDLLNYINKNKSEFKLINVIDLSSIKNEEIKEIKKLRYQEVKQVLFLPENLSTIFNVQKFKYLHAGVLENIPLFGDSDISLYSSVLICLKPNFFSQNTPYQQKFLTTFVECLKLDSKKNSYRKYNWERDDLYKSISKGFVGINILKYLCDYFVINIFVLDIKCDKLMFAGGEYYIPHRKNIFLIHHENNSFEPLYCENARFFSVSDEIIQNLRKEKKVSVYKLSNNMHFNFVEKEEDLEYYLNIKKPLPEIECEKENVDNSIIDVDMIDNAIDNVIDNVEKEKNKIYTQKELKNMKLQELQDIANSKNIQTSDKNKKKTKDQLIIEILK